MHARTGVVVALGSALAWTVPAGARPQGTGEVPAAVEFVHRPDTLRTLEHSDHTIQAALRLIGQPLNPIRVVGRDLVRQLYALTPGAGLPPNGLQAFRAGDARDPVIYVNRRARAYTRAGMAGHPLALLVLAATLVHEQVHNTDQEHAATRLEADFMRDRLPQLPRHSWRTARQYVSRLDARARALARAEARLRRSRIAPAVAGASSPESSR